MLCSCYWFSLNRSLKLAPVESWLLVSWSHTVRLPVFMPVSRGRDTMRLFFTHSKIISLPSSVVWSVPLKPLWSFWGRPRAEADRARIRARSGQL